MKNIKAITNRRLHLFRIDVLELNFMLPDQAEFQHIVLLTSLRADADYLVPQEGLLLLSGIGFPWSTLFQLRIRSDSNFGIGTSNRFL